MSVLTGILIMFGIAILAVIAGIFLGKWIVNRW